MGNGRRKVHSWTEPTLTAEQRSGPGKVHTLTKQWWRAIKNVRNTPIELQHCHRRRMKNVKCRICGICSIRTVPQHQRTESLSWRRCDHRPWQLEWLQEWLQCRLGWLLFWCFLVLQRCCRVVLEMRRRCGGGAIAAEPLPLLLRRHYRCCTAAAGRQVGPRRVFSRGNCCHLGYNMRAVNPATTHLVNMLPCHKPMSTNAGLILITMDNPSTAAVYTAASS